MDIKTASVFLLLYGAKRVRGFLDAWQLVKHNHVFSRIAEKYIQAALYGAER